ncbi:MAG: NAD-dependent epimerase/dehydratase family protein [Actinomycetota bacterium]|nr:NAD-dependent epimerase/dehydratase family protein [Actinomycetota bacterium]MED5393678.1 NAD-dependent epimerase/dehydratase family protein [Actinomycetota bacterium]MEE3353051.1 NAD-dependent epimerase/dehydratase family protein [Actinomycetota bacterium]
MKAVVTGGAGFIGSTLVDRLVDQGDDILVIDDLSSGSEANLTKACGAGTGSVALEVLDVADQKTTDVISSFQPDVVFHLAAQINVTLSVKDPINDARINIIGLLRVLEGARISNARKVVFTSSGAIYGEVSESQLPLSENTSRQPLSPYGVTKLAGAIYLDAYQAMHGLSGTTLALANVYGPRQDPHGEAGVVAIFARRLLAGQTCVVYGSGEQTRDFVFVGDVADAFVRAGATVDGGLFNIGTSIETSVNELYRSMSGLAEGPFEPERQDERTGEILRSALDSTLAGRQLGWSPTTSLENGLGQTLDWFAENAPAN